ncbi:MAG TPA: cytochrome c [Candidatus Acidoferrales bacterium]|nr:cytochrome c [Candidatus Acidoferrales bacterium]
MIRGFIIGIIATLAALVLIVYVALRSGMVPANADQKPSRLERWAAGTSLHATIARQASKAPNPLPLDDANLLAGIKLYATNCAVCHGSSDGNPSNVARGLYQKPPQLAKDGVEDDPDGITYWKVAHGIRLTGMPAFDGTLDDTQIWQVALFLKHMDGLPPAPERAWKAVH